MTIISPVLLHVLAVTATQQDGGLPAGHHVRWFPSPELGLPHDGFRLLRRPSMVYDIGKFSESIRREVQVDELVNTRHDRLQHPAGLMIDGAAGLTSGQTVERLSLDRPLTLRFHDDAQAQPAAVVRVRLMGPVGASVGAQAFHDHGSHLEPTVSATATVEEADRRWPGLGHVDLLLAGPVLDGLVIVGAGMEMTAVRWLDARAYADADGWEEVGSFSLPVRAAGRYRGVPDPAAEGAARVARHHARVSSPLDEATWPPRLLSSSERARRGRDRYLGPHLERMGAVLEQLLTTMATSHLPAAEVPLPGSGRMTTTVGPQGTAEVPLPAIPLLLAGALDPVMAGLIGLAWCGSVNLSEGEDVDYQVRATYDHAQLTAAGGEAPAPRTSAAVVGLFTHASLSVLQPVDVPVLDAEVQAAPAAEPVPARVRLDWAAQQAGTGIDAGRIGVVVRREHAGTDVYVGPVDEESGLTVFPMLGNDAGGRMDDGLPTPGRYRYRAWAADLWGRYSEPAEVLVEVEDRVPPPPPAGLTAEHGSGPGTDGRFPTVRVGFTWSAAAMRQARDVVAFDVYVGGVRIVDDPGRDGVPAGAVEVGTLLTSAPMVTIPWPDPGPTATTMAVEDGGTRIALTLSDVPAAAEAGLPPRHVTSVTIVAVDAAGNRSRPAHPAVAQWVDPTPPPSVPALPDVHQATRPDAEGRCWWRVSWSVVSPGARMQVLRADQGRLLAAADLPPTALERLSSEERADRLRELATTHRSAFAPAAPAPLDDTHRHLDVWISSRDPGLHVFVTLPQSAAGVKGIWPAQEGFTVVIGQGAPAPARPRLELSRGPAGEVTVRVTASGAATVRVYRSVTEDGARDLSGMVPLRPATVEDGTVRLVDHPPAAPWVAYRALALSATGAWSEPTAPQWMEITDLVVRSVPSRPPLGQEARGIPLAQPGEPAP